MGRVFVRFDRGNFHHCVEIVGAGFAIHRSRLCGLCSYAALLGLLLGAEKEILIHECIIPNEMTYEEKSVGNAHAFSVQNDFLVI